MKEFLFELFVIKGSVVIISLKHGLKHGKLNKSELNIQSSSSHLKNIYQNGEN